MKKILVLAFALVVVAGAFAQTPALTFGMYGDITATVSSSDSYSVYTETYLAYKAKDMGFAATIIGGNQLQVNSTGVGITTIETTPKPVDGLTTQSAFDIFGAPRNYSFWYTWCNGLKISAGRLRETGNARITSYIDGNGFSTRMANVSDGVLVHWTAVKNLSVAWFVPITGIAKEKGVNPVNVAFLDDLKKSSLGVSFGIPNVATLVAAYRSPEPDARNEASLGVDVKAIKDFALRVGFKNTEGFFFPLDKFFGPKNYLYMTLGQAKGNLNYGVDANFRLTPTSFYGIKGMVEYTIGNYVLGAKVSVDNGDDWYNNKALFVNPYIKRNFAAGNIKAGVTYNAVTSKITMPVTFNISF